MRGLLRRYEFNAIVTQSPQIIPFEQPFSPAEQNRCDSEVQFINEALTKVLLDCVRPTADPQVHSSCRLACTVEPLANTSCYEVERRIAFHLDWGTSMVGQDEDWNVIRWIVSPPAFPARVRPVPTKGAKHVPPKNPGPDILKATAGEIVVNPGRTAVLAEQAPLERACWD